MSFQYQLWRVLARIGKSDQVPRLYPGELGYDVDTKTMRVGDGTTAPPRIPTDKASGAFDFSNLSSLKLPLNTVFPDTVQVAGVKLKSMLTSTGLIAHVGGGEFRPVKLVSNDGSVAIIGGLGLDGEIDLRASGGVSSGGGSGVLNYRGTWNASTNTPNLPTPSVANNGYYYKVSVAGTTNVNGFSTWVEGDWVISNGVSWERLPGPQALDAATSTVASVAGLTGIITASGLKTALSLVKGDVGLGNVDNTSDANKPVSTAQQTALDGKVNISGDTLTGKLTTVASGTGGAGFSLPHGTAPTSPANGDIWSTTSAVLARINGATKTFSFSDHTHSGLAPSGGATGQVLKKVSNTDYDYVWDDDLTTGGGSGANLSLTGQTGSQLVISSDTGTDATIPSATTSLAGLLSASDKTTLNGLAAMAAAGFKGATAAGATVDIDVTTARTILGAGSASGLATLDGSGKLTTAQIPDSLAGGMNYQGTWNASTNSPTIPTASSTNKGYYYRVATAGTTNIGGIAEWAVGDWIVSNGTSWDKIDNTDAVASVAGLTGTITSSALKTALSLVKGDVGLGNVDNTSDANKPVSTAQQTAIDAKVSKTGDTMTGKLTTVASATGAAGFSLPHGAAPSTPANGDIWSTTSGVLARINGATKTFSFDDHTHSGLTPTGGSTGQVLKKNSGTNYDYSWGDAGSGKLVSRNYAEYTVNTNLSTVIPYDDTIPQNTEGTEILTVTITPSSVSNRVRITFNAWVGGAGTSAQVAIAALFKDSDANALTAVAASVYREIPQYNVSGGEGVYALSYIGATYTPDVNTLSFVFEHVPATTSTITYKIRVGGSAGIIRMNGYYNARLFGGAARSTLVVEELVP